MSISNTTKWLVTMFSMAMFRNRFRGYTIWGIHFSSPSTKWYTQSGLLLTPIVYRASRNRLGKWLWRMNRSTSADSFLWAMIVILMGLWLIIHAESKPLPSLQHVIEIEESFCSMCEKSNESQRCLRDDGDVIMVIGKEFNLSSAGSLQCGSNEVLQCVILSEVILASCGKSRSIICDDIEVIQSCSGFRFDRKASEWLLNRLSGIIDVENGFFITHRIQLRWTRSRKGLVILQRTIDGFSHSILLAVLNEVEMDENHQQKSNVPIVELNHVTHYLLKNSLTIMRILFRLFSLLLPFLVFSMEWRTNQIRRDVPSKMRSPFRHSVKPTTKKTFPNSIYYPWNDGVGERGMESWGVDYDRLCRIILKRVNSSSYEYTILNDGLWGGLGHKHVSLIVSITYAIVLKRNFRSVSLHSP